MRRNLRLLMTALLCAVLGPAWAQSPEVSLDFTTNDAWQLPVGSANKATDAATFTNDEGYAITLTAETGYYFNTQGYLMLGKAGSTLTLPAFSFAVGSIEVVGNSGASGAVEQNIFVGETEVSAKTIGAKGTNVYAIASAYQAAGNIYTLKVLSAHNTQITKINIYKAGGATVKPVPNMSFNPTTTTAIIGKDFTEPVLTYDGDGTVTYSSEDETIATVDASTGEVTPVGVGSTNIVATATETDNYNGVSTSYKLAVVESQGGEVEDGLFDFTGFTDYGTGLVPNSDSSSESFIYDDYTWTAGKVTLTSSGKYRWWLAGAGNTLRFYNNVVDEVQTSKMTIAVPDGYVITGISITGGQQFVSDDGLYTSSNGKWEGEAQSVTLRYAASSGNVAVKTVTVTYQSGEAPPEKLTPTMKFSGTYYTVEEGEDFEIPELTYDGDGTITYSSDNEDAVTVDPSTGVVDIVAEGTAVITATASETDTYKGATATYTINVIKGQGTHEVVDGLFDFTDKTNYGTSLSPSTSDEYFTDPVTWKAGNVTLVSEGKYRWWMNANGNSLRFYTNVVDEVQTSKMTISVPEGKVITSIVINGSKINQFTVDTGEYADGTWTGNAQSVVFTYAPSGTISVSTVTVTYGGNALADPQLAWSAETLDVVLGEEFTAPTLSAAEGFDLSIVTYSTSNASVATIDESGTLAIVGAGTAVITATAATSEAFLGGSASYTVNVTKPTQPATGSYALVTDASTLAAGDEIIIVGTNTPKVAEGEEVVTNYYALGTNQKNNNREGVSVVMEPDGTITANADVQAIILEEGWYFNVGGEYLYAAGSNKSNYLRTEAEIDENGNAKAVISIEDGVATITFQGTNTNSDMRFNYNGGTPLFACYNPENASMPRTSIYKKVGSDILLGDANGDGQVTVSDATLVVEYVLSGKATSFVFKNADVNGDGNVNITDASLIVGLVLNQ